MSRSIASMISALVVLLLFDSAHTAVVQSPPMASGRLALKAGSEQLEYLVRRFLNLYFVMDCATTGRVLWKMSL